MAAHGVVEPLDVIEHVGSGLCPGAVHLRGWPWGQSGAHSKKPRVVRGSERLTTRLSELAGLVLAGQKRLFN